MTPDFKSVGTPKRKGLQKIAFKSYCCNWRITQAKWDFGVKTHLKAFNMFFPQTTLVTKSYEK